MTTSQYLNGIKSGAIEGWRTHQVLPSITGAQAALESGWGTSSLAQSPYNNNFGIKASDDWTGRIVTMPTKEWTNSGYITVQADFRAYDSIADSVRDHAAFFTNTPWREQNYKDVIGERDYKKAAWALQNAPAPYATDPGYATKLTNIIENNKLDEWDKEALTGQTTSPTTPSLNQPDMQPKPKKTGAELSTAGRSFVQSLKVSVIGDSLGVGTEPYLKQLIPNSNYDVVGSRQITHSIESLDGTRALTKMKSNGTLHDYVVVILGTNRGVTEQEVNNFASIAGNSRKVLFVNTASQVGHANEVSRVYNKISTSLSNAYFVDWQTYALSLREAWYYSDGSNGEYIHMNADGYRRHAEFIAQAIYESATADFSEETAVDTLTAYTNIATIELTPDGMISFDAFDMDGNKVHFDRDIGVKGLSSPMGDFHIYNHEANESWNTQDSNEFGANWIEGFYEDSNRKLDIMLIEEAAKYMDQHREPSAQYTVSLFEVPQNLSIGDTGIFIDHEFTPPLYIQARVLSISTSRTNSSLNKVTIGNVVEIEPMEKDSTIALQGELSRIRDGIYDQWVKGEPPRLEIIALDSTTLTDENTEVLLICKVFQGNIEVTEQFSNFIWSRVSEDTVSDSYFNDVIYDAETSSVINVKARDLEGIASTFLCRVYDDAGDLVGSVGAIVREAVQGKSAFEFWKEYMNLPDATMEEYIEYMRGKDGDQGIPGDSSYLHTAWATDPLGTNFSTEPFEGATYLGTCTTESPEDPKDYNLYDWVYVKGDPGLTDEEREELMDSIEDTYIIKDLIGLDGGQTFNKNRLDGPVNRVIAKGSSTSIKHNGDGYKVGDKITISADVSCLIKENTSNDVTFNFDIVPFVPPVDPTSDVTFNFTSEGIHTDDWYATPSVKLSNINRAPSTWRTMSLVDDFGAVGDGITDDSQALKDALQHSNTEPIRLDVGGSEYEYYIPSNGNNRVENYPGVSKGIVIFGNGAVFAPKNERTIDRHEFYLMQIRAEKNTFIETSGFTLDGKHNPQDMFWWISQGKATRAADLPLQKGISYEGPDNIYIHDMTYRNMYGGYLIKLKNYTNVNVQNVRGYSVGGNDNPDSFGTIVHIDGQPDDSFINIDDMVIHGKKSPLNPAWVSWIGIVIENGTTQSDNPAVRLADRNTNIHVTNSEFYDFESLYHIETQAGNIYWNTDNVKARVMNYTIGAGVRGEIKDRSNHMQLDILPFMRKGLSSGLYHTYRERPSNNLTDENGAFNYFHMYNSIINYLPKEDYVGGVDVHAISHADSVVGNLHNVTLNNVPRWLVANASANLYDTQVNLKQGHNSSYSIFSNQEQFLNIHGTSSYNQVGSWKEASEGSYPPLAVNTGFVAPPLTGKIGDILPPA